MRELTLSEVSMVAGGGGYEGEGTSMGGGYAGGDPQTCKNDALAGFGIGATVGGVIGSAFGPVGIAIGTLAVGLAGGAAAVSGNPACGGGDWGNN